MKTYDYPPFLIFLILFILLSLCSSSDADADADADYLLYNQSKAVGPYDQLHLVFTWPNTFCLNVTDCRKPVRQTFLVHGLWPADKNGTSLTNCKTTERVADYVNAAIEEKLNDFWPTLKTNRINCWFWQHEWDKHGSCATNVGVPEYLDLIILQAQSFDLLGTLKSKNIIPNGTSYTRASIEAAVKSVIGQKTNFYISCDSQKVKDTVLLKEIYICLNAAGNGVISCPTSQKPRGCTANKNIVFTAPA